MHRTAQSGFTLAELLVAISIFMLASGMGAMTAQSAIPLLRVDGQAQRVTATLQHARELAIASRRDIEVRFVDDQRMDVLRRDGADEALVASVTFEYGVRFLRWNDMPDTPDGFGAGDAIDFGDAAALFFVADGTFIDETGVPVSGTIHVGIENRRATARAVALAGPTARARLWRWTGTGWVTR